MTVEQYEGRTVDMQAWSVASANGDVLVDEQTTGTICTGIVKLAQRFLITFLNELDTIKYNYDGTDIQQGTTFMRNLREGQIHTEADLYSSFALAELQARAQLQAEETGDEPDDERYASSVLTAVELTGQEAVMTININSQSESVTIIVPVSIMVQP